MAETISKPLRIQLALQGGGAKLVALIAVLEAVEELEKDGSLRVTRIAGTSAGAIVGTLFAARIPMRDLRAAIESIDLGPIQGGAGKLRRWYRILRGRPIWPEEFLSSELQKILDTSDADPTETDTLGRLGSKFGIRVHLTATDIKARRLDQSTSESLTIDKIVDSCSLPFVFRNYKSSKGTILDGGICENLPSELLYKYEGEDGPVIAISFATSSNPEPKNLLQYVWAMIDTSLSRSTDRTVNRIPGRVHSIRTDIGTLDFERAFSKDYKTDEHLKIKSSADVFFRKLIKAGPSFDGEGQTSGDPWKGLSSEGASPMGPDAVMMRRMGRVYESLRKLSDIVFDEYVMTVTAHGLSSKSGDRVDEVRSRMTMRSTRGLVWAYGFYISSAAHETVLYQNRCSALDHNGNDVLSATVPILASRKGDDRRYVCTFFDKPAQEGGKAYKIHCVDTIEDFVAPLRDTGEDKFWITVGTTHVQLAIIVLHVPIEFGKLYISASEESDGAPEVMDNASLVRHRESCPADYETYGWICRDLPPNTKFEIAVKKV